MNTQKQAFMIRAAVCFFLATAIFQAQAQTTITFTIIPEESPLSVEATLKYENIELLKQNAQKNLEGSFQVIVEPDSGTFHTIQVVGMEVELDDPISFTASEDVGGGVKVQLAVSIIGVGFSLTGESTATLVDSSGSATISLHEIQLLTHLQYQYKIDFPIISDINRSGSRTITHTIKDPFTFTISPVSDVDAQTTLTAQFHLEHSITENLGDGFSVKADLSATVTGQFAPPPPPKAFVKNFNLYDRCPIWVHDLIKYWK